MQEQQQLRQPWLHTLGTAVFEVRVEIAEESLVDAVVCAVRRIGRFDHYFAGCGTCWVGAEGVASAGRDACWLGVGGGDEDVLALEGEDVATR